MPGKSSKHRYFLCKGEISAQEYDVLLLGTADTQSQPGDHQNQASLSPGPSLKKHPREALEALHLEVYVPPPEAQQQSESAAADSDEEEWAPADMHGTGVHGVAAIDKDGGLTSLLCVATGKRISMLCCGLRPMS
jgi:hypothetical protein